MSFFLTLQVCDPEFPVSTKADSKKNGYCNCSEIVENLPGKFLMSLFIRDLGATQFVCWDKKF